MPPVLAHATSPGSQDQAFSAFYFSDMFLIYFILFKPFTSLSSYFLPPTIAQRPGRRGGWGLLGSGRFCFYTLISFLKFDEGSCWFLRDPRDQTRAVRLLIDFLIEGRPLWSPFLTLFNSIFLKSPSDFLNLCGCGLGGSWFFPRPEFSGLHLFSTTLYLFLNFSTCLSSLLYFLSLYHEYRNSL